VSTSRIALANLRFPASAEESIALATAAIGEAGTAGADILCFPECYIPGYRCLSRKVPHVDAAFLDRAWSTVAAAVRSAQITVILGTERIVDGTLRISAAVFSGDGSIVVTAVSAKKSLKGPGVYFGMGVRTRLKWSLT